VPRKSAEHYVACCVVVGSGQFCKQALFGSLRNFSLDLTSILVSNVNVKYPQNKRAALKDICFKKLLRTQFT
jgi:hypothetical protein